MIFVINGNEITINSVRDLIAAAASLPETEADELMLKILEKPDVFRAVFEHNYALRTGLKDLPERQAVRLVVYLLKESEELIRLIPNNFSLVTTVANIREKLADMLMGHIFSYPMLYRHLIDNQIAFVKTVNTLPDKYARELMDYVLRQPGELRRLVKNKYHFEGVIRDLLEKYRMEVIETILSDPEFVVLLIDDLDTLKLYLDIMPEAAANKLIAAVTANTSLFTRIINTSLHLQVLVRQFKEQAALPLIQKYDSVNQASALHTAATSRPDLVPELLKFGSRPCMGELPEENTLHYLLNMKNCPLANIITLIELGADPQTRGRDESTSLHRAVESDAAGKYVPLLIQMGVDVMARNHRGQTALQTLLAKPVVSAQDIEPALALIQHGDQPDAKTPGGKTVLQLAYQHYPRLKAYVTARLAKKDKADDPAYVFAHINIASMRLEVLKYDAVHQAKRNYVNLLLWLVYHRSHDNPGSFFRIAPPDLLARIIRHLDFAAMGKTVQEGLALADYMFQNAEGVRQLTGKPGGTSVFQRDRENGQPGFSLFQSVKTLCRDYDAYKEYLKTSQHRRHPVYDKMTGKEFTNTSLLQLSDFRNNHAATVLRQHLSLFKNKRNKQVLVEAVEGTELFNPVNTLK